VNTCQYCDKTFKTERTLSVHMCVKKKRMLDKDTIGSSLGFRVFQRFYELTTKAKTLKTFDEFIRSRYYMSFVKFGRHLANLNAIDTNAFVDYVINNGFPLDDWPKDSVYFMFLKKHIEEEHHERAIERTFLQMEQWSSQNGCEFNKFFEHVNTFEATALIKSGRISPWVLYLSDGGGKLLDSFSEEQMVMIEDVITPTIWRDKFLNNKENVKIIKSALKEANI